MPHSTQKAKLAVWIPILVTIASLTFGAFQYFDKRVQEQALLKLEVEKKELELKIIEEERRQKQADISINYVVTDFQSIQECIDHQATFDEALLKWLSSLEKVLPFETSLQIRENTVYAEIKSYDKDIINHNLTFLLLRNAGKSNATNIRIGFRGLEQEASLVINRLEPRQGVMVPIEHYDNQTKKHFGTWLIPDIRLTYFDIFLDKNKELKVREKNKVAVILGPTLRIHR